MKIDVKVNAIVFFIFLQLSAVAKTNEYSSIYLNKGEFQAFDFLPEDRFIVGNRKILRVKYLKKKQQIIVKGLKAGQSSLNIISKSRPVQKFQFIVSKSEQLKTMNSIMELLKAEGIPYKKLARKKVKLLTPIKTYTHYISLHSFLKKSKGVISIDGQLTKDLKQQILLKAYQPFFDLYIDSISCRFKGISCHCTLAENEYGGKQLIAKLAKEDFISFSYQERPNSMKNFYFKFKIYEVHINKGDLIDLAPDALNISWKDLFSKKLDSLYKDDLLKVGDTVLNYKLLSEHQSILELGEKTSLRIGGEMSFKEQNAQGINSLQWKFFGITVTIDTQKFGKYLKTKYQINLSTPVKDKLSTFTSSKSVANLLLNKPIEIFRIKSNTRVQDQSTNPIFSQIPILKSLFSHTQNTSQEKIVYGVLMIHQGEK